nr:MAG TPA: tail tube protein [Caudoviricetes sp.]
MKVMKRILLLLFLVVFLISCSEDEPVVTGISLDKSELTLKIGESYQFKLSHMPLKAKSPKCQWYLSKYYPNCEGCESYEVGTIDQNGLFTAIRDGEVYVTVFTLEDYDPVTYKSYDATCKVTVLPIEATSLTLNNTEEIMNIGETISLEAKIEPENTTHKDVKWESNNPNIVSVRNDEVFGGKAVVTALQEGEAIITASVGSITATCKITVNPTKLEGISFDQAEKTVKEGESFVLTPVFTPENASNKKVIWTSSNQSIATVDQEGKVSTHSFGECIIKAISEDGGFEAICKVIVLEPTIEEAIKVNIYGSYTSFNGFVTGDITAAFYNNSSKTVEVTDFTVYDTRTNKIIFQQENCGLAEKEKPIRYNLKFSGVYKPLFLWHYHHSGKSYTCEYRM